MICRRTSHRAFHHAVALSVAVISCFVLTEICHADLLDDGNFSMATSGTQTSNSAWTLTVNLPDGTDPAAQFQSGFANAQNTGAGGTEPPGTGTGV